MKSTTPATTVATLTEAQRAHAIEAAANIGVEQLRNWTLYPSGKEGTVDALGYAVVMNTIGRATFRHRIATDPEAAAQCVSWDGLPPSEDLREGGSS